MTPQELKNSILQLAIQGKLVEQRAEEGTGRELLENILAAKNAEGAEKGKGKSHAKSAKSAKVRTCVSREEIPDDEKPFDIPESWTWARLGEVADINGGFAFKSTHYTSKGVRVIRISDFAETGFVNDKIVRYSYDETLKPYVLEEKNILLCMTGGTVGKSLFVSKMNEQMVVNQRVAMIKVRDAIPEYVYKVILAPTTQKVIQDSKNSTNDNISMDTIKGFIVPLPPLAEQKRIVAKIEELMPLVERYEKAWSKLKDFNKRFPADMQKSLLQLAIQGKLVEQRAEEGTGRKLLEEILAAKNAEGAKGKGEKSHAKSAKSAKVGSRVSREEIPDDEKPFDIPKTWKWVRFGHIMINRDAERIPLSVDERSKLAKKYDYYGASGVIDKVDDFIFDKPLLLIGEDGANLLTRNTPIAFIARGKYWVNNHAHVLDCNSDLVHIEYVMWFINAINLAPYVTGTAQPKMNQQKMNSIPVALPPLAEQKRIVAKLEELLPLCERLK